MTSQLDVAVERYQTSLQIIQEIDSPLPKQIMEILIARDFVGKALSEVNQASPELLSAILQLDQSSKRTSSNIK